MNGMALGALIILITYGAGGCGKAAFHGSGKADNKSGKSAPTGREVPSVQEASQTERDSSVSTGQESSEEVAAKTESSPTPSFPATPTPIPPTLALGPCSPKGKIPTGFTFDFDQKLGGALVLRGTPGDDVLAISGRDVGGEILLNGGPDANGFSFGCVKSFVYNAGAGNDTILLGGPLRALDSVTVNGDAGNDNVTLTGNIGQVGNVTVNGGS